MKVSAKAEYGCLAMMKLAEEYARNQPVQVKAIAEAHGISARFLVQILLQLKGAGLVASSRGAAGGYQLTRPPATISLADIVQTIDRSPRVSSALDELSQSDVVIALRRVWDEVNQEEQRILESTSLADLLARSRDHVTSNYQI